MPSGSEYSSSPSPSSSFTSLAYSTRKSSSSVSSAHKPSSSSKSYRRQTPKSSSGLFTGQSALALYTGGSSGTKGATDYIPGSGTVKPKACPCKMRVKVGMCVGGVFVQSRIFGTGKKFVVKTKQVTTF
ncbi:hypothetical protein EX30DRAFT_386399 [Ascodesmis nigricans]|uniref:Uncharacterized protein n=1 Tax=Ascodesmis nigricans TaxID=341454 RepID=A0A4S2MKU8_9PEZI|nr:hypothetical protein EX30DRAFT_386399 [Ascodesmis nigricans]